MNANIETRKRLQILTEDDWQERVMMLDPAYWQKVACVVWFDMCKFTPFREAGFFRSAIHEPEVYLSPKLLAECLEKVGYTVEMIGGKFRPRAARELLAGRINV